MKLSQVIEILQTKDQDQEVQYIVAADGRIVAMEAKDEFVDVMKFMKAFKRPKK